MGSYDPKSKRSIGRAKVRQDQGYKSKHPIRGLAVGLTKTELDEAETGEFLEFIAQANREPAPRRIVRVLVPAPRPTPQPIVAPVANEDCPFEPGSFHGGRVLTYEELKWLDIVRRGTRVQSSTKKGAT